MYTVTQLRELVKQPKINDISLKILQEYYLAYLNPFIYYYNIKDKYNNKEYTIELRFNIENFCHLLGLEYIVKQSVSFKYIFSYKGFKGWENVKNETINFNDLKQKNKKRFNNVKAKFVYFYVIPQLIQNPKGIIYNKDLVNPATNIESEILFYDTYNNSVIHLGIEKHSAGYYVPRTFLIEKITVKNDGKKYLNNQIIIDVKVKSRTILCE